MASVGPYILCRRARGRTCLKRVISCGGSASPPQIRCRSIVHARMSGSCNPACCAAFRSLATQGREGTAGVPCLQAGGAHLELRVQLRRDKLAHGDTLRGDELRQVLRVLLAARHRQHHPAAARQRAEQLLRSQALGDTQLSCATRAGQALTSPSPAQTGRS